MSSNFSYKNTIPRLLVSGLAITGGAVASYCMADSANSTGLVVATPIQALGNVGVEFFGGAFEEHFLGKTPREELLKNGDLTRATGKAIFAIFLDQSKIVADENDKEILHQIGNAELSVWEEIILKIENDETFRIDVPQEVLDEVSPDKLTKYFRADEGEIDKLTALSPRSWRIIVDKICEKEKRLSSVEAANQLADKLHQNFPKALRKVLIDSSEDDGKAFRSLLLRILSELLFDSKQHKQDNQEIKDKLNVLFVRINELRWLNNSNTKDFNPEFWQKAFDTTQNIETIAIETSKDVKEIKELITEFIKEFRSFSQTSKPLIPQFNPKNFPQRVDYFTGRQNVLTQIKNLLHTHGTAALADVPGVGKTSILLEYAYLQQEKYSTIMFIRATENEFYTFVSDILDGLNIKLPNDAKPEQRLAVFQDWLAKNENWLLLVDNVDDVPFVQSCEFNKPTGKVIYSSNNDQIYKVGRRVDVPKMLDDNAMLLLYKHWKVKSDAKFEEIPEKYHDALKGIANLFGNHPFSMAFVGSYLTDEQSNLDEFLVAYQQKEKNLLAKHEFLSTYHLKNEGKHTTSVATAFILKFEQISTSQNDTEKEQFLCVAVKDYLKLSAYIGTDRIPEELLSQSLAILHPDQSEWTADNDFIKSIYARFKPTSIFKRDAEAKTLETHRIVQEIMRFQIEAEEDVILQTLAECLADNFEPFDFTNKEKVERYLTHVGIFLEYLEAHKLSNHSTLKLSDESTAKLCNRYARYFDAYGQYDEAQKYCELSKDICEAIADIDQNLLATTYNNLGGLCQTQGEYKLAEEYHLKALAIREKELGENHPSTAKTYNNLAALYDNKGDLNLAQKYQQKSLNIRIANFGESHPDVAQSYWWLGTFCEKDGKFKAALENYYKAREIHLRFLPQEHPTLQRLQRFIDKCERLLG